MRRGSNRWAVLIALGVLAACGFEGAGSLSLEDGPSASDASDERVDPRRSSRHVDAKAVPLPDDASADAPPEAAADSGLLFPFVYGHTVTTLYRLEPVTKTFAVVGPLTGCSGMSDIAVDRNGKIVGVGSALYAIDPTTGACTTLALGVQPFTLTFVPQGTVDSAAEALVAYVDSDYYRVNRTTGAAHPHHARSDHAPTRPAATSCRSRAAGRT